MKVLMISEFFLKGHSKAGQPTFFPEKIFAGLADQQYVDNKIDEIDQFFAMNWEEYYNCELPKSHTIRAGNRWKVGDMASLRVWSSKPYRSKQIEFAQVEIKKVWSIRIEGYNVWINKRLFTRFSFTNQIASLAHNDGLGVQDFWDWFPTKPGKFFQGQIICWNESINY